MRLSSAPLLSIVRGAPFPRDRAPLVAIAPRRLLLLWLSLPACSLTNYDSFGRGGAGGAELPDTTLNDAGGQGGSSSAGAGGGAPAGAAGNQAGSGGSGGTVGAAGAGGTNAGAAGSGEPDYQLFIDAGVGQNVVSDPSFDDSVALWSHFGAGVVERLEVGCSSEPGCLRSTQRGDFWTGPIYDLRGYVIPSRNYEVRLWARAAESSNVKVSIKTLCQGATQSTYDTVEEQLSEGDWLELVGVVRVRTCPIVSLHLLVEGPDGGIDLDVDDVSVTLVE